MSDLEVDTGPIQAQPTVEGQQNVRNKDAYSDRQAKQKHLQIVITGFHRPICLRLIALRMINICKELGLMLLIAVTYAALTNDPPKISRSPHAYPFFAKNSPVKDYYRGELTKAIELARQSDIAFVMFYAPWDAESQEVRKEFELTAKYMQKLVSFNAINCWQPNGECRNHYNKVYNWPVLIVYPPHGRGIQYNGPKSALHMIKFLNCFMMPFVRVNNLEVQHLRQTHDAVVVANVDPSPGSLDYAIIYSTALRYLERDPFQEVIFAINTEYRTTGEKLVSLYMWNNTMIYIEGDWKVDSLLNWVQRKVAQVTIWASPVGTKSQLLSNYIQPGPALILFTPRNPLYDSIDYYDLLHEVALQYYYCKNNTRNFGAYLLSLSIHYNRIDNYKKGKNLCTISAENSQNTPKSNILSTVTYLNANRWTNNSYCVSPVKKTNNEGTCLNNDINHIIKDRFGREESAKYKEEFDEMYKNMLRRNTEEKINKDAWIQTDYTLESYKNVYKTSMLTGINDVKSPRNLQRIHKQNKCKLKAIAEKFDPQFFSKSLALRENAKIDITGMACQVNRSLSMIAMDSLKYHHFASSLSVDILKRTHKTALVILDEKMESHYVLDDEVTDVSIREFIRNYSESRLKRALVVSDKRYDYTHTYTPPVLKNGNRRLFRVKELNSLNFLSTVMRRNKAIVILYHSKQCSFCNGVSYIFLTTAKVFSSVIHLKFARIDGDMNTLPWEYTMDTYPTILFFPDLKKSESRIFPRDMLLTVTNLVNFILTNLSPSLKLHAMWSLCNHTKFREENEVCISKIRIETLSLIEGSLKQWRVSDMRDRAAILDRLRELKHLHLLLAHLSADRDTIQKHMRKLHRRMSGPVPGHRKKTKKSNNIL